MSYRRFYAQVRVSTHFPIDVEIDVDSHNTEEAYLIEKIQEQAVEQVKQVLPEDWADDVEVAVASIK